MIKKFAELSKIIVELLDCKTKVENLIKTALDFDELNRGFIQLIRDYAIETTDELALSLSQCFLKNFSENHPDQLSIYAAWKETISKGKETVV